FSAHVMQHLVAAGEEHVGNDLLVRRIGLGLRARKKEIVSAREDRAQIFLRLEIEPVKIAELIEQAASDDENVCVRRIHCNNVVILSEAKKLRLLAFPVGVPNEWFEVF